MILTASTPKLDPLSHLEPLRDEGKLLVVIIQMFSLCVVATCATSDNVPYYN